MVELFPGEFLINGNSSYGVYKTIIQDRPDLSTPKRKMTTVSPYAFDGLMVYDHNAFENTELELSLATLSEENERARYRNALYAALSTGGYVDLEFYFDPGMIYRGLLTDSYSYTNKENYEGIQVSKVKLSISPYKRYKESHILRTINIPRSDVISQPAPYAISFPTFQIDGNGIVNISVHDKRDPAEPIVARYDLQNLEPGKPVVIDNDLKSTYGFESPTLANKRPFNANAKLITREFMILKHDYVITTTGSIRSLEISPNWRALV